MSTSPKIALPSLATTLFKHFDPTKSTLKANSANSTFKRLGFGRDLSDHELMSFCGAPAGSKVTLSHVNERTIDEKTPEGVLAEIENATYFDRKMQLIFHKKNKRRHVYIKLVMVSKNTPLVATSGLILESMLRQNDKVSATEKFVTYSMLAAGGREWDNIGKTKDRWGGYAAWPRYGFDMPLLSDTTDMFDYFPHVPPLVGAAATCVNVSSLLTLNKGMEFWDLVGEGWYMNFDTSPSSYSRNTLASYLGGKYS